MELHMPQESNGHLEKHPGNAEANVTDIATSNSRKPLDPCIHERPPTQKQELSEQPHYNGTSHDPHTKWKSQDEKTTHDPCNRAGTSSPTEHKQHLHLPLRKRHLLASTINHPLEHNGSHAPTSTIKPENTPNSTPSPTDTTLPSQNNQHSDMTPNSQLTEPTEPPEPSFNAESTNVTFKPPTELVHNFNTTTGTEPSPSLQTTKSPTIAENAPKAHFQLESPSNTIPSPSLDQHLPEVRHQPNNAQHTNNVRTPSPQPSPSPLPSPSSSRSPPLSPSSPPSTQTPLNRHTHTTAKNVQSTSHPTSYHTSQSISHPTSQSHPSTSHTQSHPSHSQHLNHQYGRSHTDQRHQTAPPPTSPLVGGGDGKNTSLKGRNTTSKARSKGEATGPSPSHAHPTHTHGKTGGARREPYGERESDSEEEEDDDDDDDEEVLYCFCRRPYDPTVDVFMIGCDVCDEWYHGSCVGVSQKEAKKIARYVCPRCKKIPAPSSSSSSSSPLLPSSTASSEASSEGEPNTPPPQSPRSSSRSSSNSNSVSSKKRKGDGSSNKAEPSSKRQALSPTIVDTSTNNNGVVC